VGGNGAPLKDRQVSLSLVLELAIQRGRLLYMLKALLLLLRLTDNDNVYFTSPAATVTTGTADSDDKEDDESVTYDNEGTINQAPIVPILRRVADIPAREIKRYSSGKKKDENSVSVRQK